MERREFLISTVAVAGLATMSRGWAQDRDEGKMSRIAIMTWAFNSILKDNQPASPERTLEIMDIGQVFADRFGVHNIELQHTHLPSTETSWLKEFRAQLEKTKSRVTNINLEFGQDMNINADTAVGRLQAIDLTKRWIDHALVLGCPRVMVNQGRPTEEKKPIAIATLKAMADYGKSKNIMVSMENRGGGRGPQGSPGASGREGAPAAPPAQAAPPPEPAGPPAHVLLVEIMKGAGAYANIDTGNFPNQEQQLDAIRMMMPLTDGNLHVKNRHDVPKALALIRELGYKGIYSIEGTRDPDPYETTQTLLDIVLPNM